MAVLLFLASMLAVYCAQECLETFFSHGHLPAVADLLAAGGGAS